MDFVVLDDFVAVAIPNCDKNNKIKLAKKERKRNTALALSKKTQIKSVSIEIQEPYKCVTTTIVPTLCG